MKTKPSDIQTISVKTTFVSGSPAGQGSIQRSSFASDGGSPVSDAQTIQYGAIRTTNPHMQFSAVASGNFEIIENSDDTKRIVIVSVQGTGHDVAATSDPRVVVLGTLAEEGSSDDVIRYQIDYVSGLWETCTPVVLGAGKSLIHYNLKGPGMGGATMPAFLNINYYLADV
jgi:hypothetical protein